MKRFAIPNDVQLVDALTGKPVFKPVTFREFAIQMWLNDKRMGTPQTLLARLGAVILPKFTKANAGDVIELEDADFDSLLPVVSEPGETAYGPLLALQLLPFADAFKAAETIDEKEGTNGVQPHRPRGAAAHANRT